MSTLLIIAEERSLSGISSLSSCTSASNQKVPYSSVSHSQSKVTESPGSKSSIDCVPPLYTTPPAPSYTLPLISGLIETSPVFVTITVISRLVSFSAIIGSTLASERPMS